MRPGRRAPSTPPARRAGPPGPEGLRGGKPGLACPAPGPPARATRRRPHRWARDPPPAQTGLPDCGHRGPWRNFTTRGKSEARSLGGRVVLPSTGISLLYFILPEVTVRTYLLAQMGASCGYFSPGLVVFLFAYKNVCICLYVYAIYLHIDIDIGVNVYIYILEITSYLYM